MSEKDMAMQDLKKQVKLTWWPSPQDYNEAVQQPLTSFSDFDLVNGAIFVDALGIPKPACGAFASVYRVRSNRGQHAVRCFLRNVSEQQARYQMITDYVQNDNLPYTVSFEYLTEGIRVHKDWFPLLKMDWVSGLTLDYHIALNFRDSKALDTLGTKFRTMCDDLRTAGIAHGDLQHGNIIMCGEELRLVDYDGMFVPAMAGLPPTELGHRNYQHPQRGEKHFGPYLDNFSAWVIYASIRAIAIDSSLFLRFQCGDDCLLFKREDFLKPEESAVFRAMEHHLSDEIKQLARFIRAQLKVDPAAVPPLAPFAPDVVLADLPALQKPEPTPVKIQDETELPDWLKQGAVMAEAEQKQSQLPDWMQEDAGSYVQATVRPKVGHPPELIQMTPRRFKARNGFFEPWTAHAAWTCVLLPLLATSNALMAVVGGMLMVLINLLVMRAYPLSYGHAKFVENGILGVAQVTKKAEIGGQYFVTYRFEAEPGNVLTVTKEVTKDAFYKMTAIRSQTTVLYMVNDPSKNMLYDACGYEAVL